jgi:hypothetical protein
VKGPEVEVKVNVDAQPLRELLMLVENYHFKQLEATRQLLDQIGVWQTWYTQPQHEGMPEPEETEELEGAEDGEAQDEENGS